MIHLVKRIYIHITGFGAFHGVDDNPTTHLIRTILERGLSAVINASQPGPSSNSGISTDIEARLGICKILHVSAVGSLLEIEAEQRKFEVAHAESLGPETRQIWLHFGVNAGTSQLNLERMGWNEAHFSCPDEKGWMPSRQRIDSDHPPTQALSSNLPLSALMVRLQPDFNCALSTDPGRFICNFTYYSSARRAMLLPCEVRPDVLFTHVPLFSVFPLDTQLGFVDALCREIVRHAECENRVLQRFLALSEGSCPVTLSRWWFRLRDLYREFPRAYHTMHHLDSLLTMADQHLPATLPRAPVDWCIIFHDAIYDPTSPDNEALSASLWMEFASDPAVSLSLSPSDVEAVQSWILATKHHMQNSPPPDSALAYFLDFDLSILASSPEEYAVYARAIRHEYQHYPDADYKAGRIKVLESFLARPTCYFTQHFQSNFNHLAHQNMKQEIHSLQTQRIQDNDNY